MNVYSIGRYSYICTYCYVYCYVVSVYYRSFDAREHVDYKSQTCYEPMRESIHFNRILLTCSLCAAADEARPNIFAIQHTTIYIHRGSDFEACVRNYTRSEMYGKLYIVRRALACVTRVLRVMYTTMMLCAMCVYALWNNCWRWHFWVYRERAHHVPS